MWELILLLIGLSLIALVIWANRAKECNAVTDEQLDKWEEHLAYSDDLAKEVAAVPARDLRSAPSHELEQLESALRDAREVISGEGASREEERIVTRLRRQQARVRVARDFKRDLKL